MTEALPNDIAPARQKTRHASDRPLRTAAALAGLTMALPITLAAVGACLAVRAVSRADGEASNASARDDRPRKTVMISGAKMTKALQLARSFHAAGHRVVLIETHDYWLTGHRFSRAVAAFHTTPAPGSPDYIAALQHIIEREQVDVYVPVCSPVASLYDSQAVPELNKYCEVVHVGPDQIARLDDKHEFAATAEALGLRVPKTIRVESAEDVLAFDFLKATHPFILKSLRYDAIRRLDLTRLPRPTREQTEAYVRSLPISADNSWVLQEFIDGREYCTHGTLRDGELRVHCCCESSPFQINYAPTDKPEIRAWIERFGEALALTGQASFDFIESHRDGKLYAIECNPRTHSAITMLYDQPAVAAAYLGDDIGDALASTLIEPTAASRPTYWLAHELWRFANSLTQPAEAIAHGKEAVFDWRDPLPFLMLHHWQIPLLLARSLRGRRDWLRIDFNIGKLTQLGGD